MNHWKKYRNLLQKNKRLVCFLAGLFFLVLFSLLTLEVFKDSRIQTIDQLILSFIGRHLRFPFLNRIAIGLSSLGSPVCITIVSLVSILALLKKRDFIGILFQFLAVSGATLWMNFLKNWLSRPRPQIIDHLVVATGKSYPSGHSLVGASTFLALAILLCHHMKPFSKKVLVYSTALSIIILIACSRVYLGVHYPSDVLGGMLFGTSWVLLLTAFIDI